MFQKKTRSSSFISISKEKPKQKRCPLIIFKSSQFSFEKPSDYPGPDESDSDNEGPLTATPDANNVKYKYTASYTKDETGSFQEQSKISFESKYAAAARAVGLGAAASTSSRAEMYIC